MAATTLSQSVTVSFFLIASLLLPGMALAQLEEPTIRFNRNGQRVDPEANIGEFSDSSFNSDSTGESTIINQGVAPQAHTGEFASPDFNSSSPENSILNGQSGQELYDWYSVPFN